VTAVDPRTAAGNNERIDSSMANFTPLVQGCGVTPKALTLTTLLIHPFNGLYSRTTWVNWYQKGKTSLDLNEARDEVVLGSCGISWTICKQSAPRSIQITTPVPRHSIFYRPDALPDAQPTVSKH